jgi:hypothetical protein
MELLDLPTELLERVLGYVTAPPRIGGDPRESRRAVSQMLAVLRVCRAFRTISYWDVVKLALATPTPALDANLGTWHDAVSFILGERIAPGIVESDAVDVSWKALVLVQRVSERPVGLARQIIADISSHVDNSYSSRHIMTTLHRYLITRADAWLMDQLADGPLPESGWMLPQLPHVMFMESRVARGKFDPSVDRHFLQLRSVETGRTALLRAWPLSFPTDLKSTAIRCRKWDVLRFLVDDKGVEMKRGDLVECFIHAPAPFCRWLECLVPNLTEEAWPLVVSEVTRDHTVKEAADLLAKMPGRDFACMEARHAIGDKMLRFAIEHGFMPPEDPLAYFEMLVRTSARKMLRDDHERFRSVSTLKLVGCLNPKKARWVVPILRAQGRPISATMLATL